jgi:hypothetical protein
MSCERVASSTQCVATNKLQYNLRTSTSHFTKGQILIVMFSRRTLLEAGRGNLVEKIGIHFHFRLG